MSLSGRKRRNPNNEGTIESAPETERLLFYARMRNKIRAGLVVTPRMVDMLRYELGRAENSGTAAEVAAVDALLNEALSYQAVTPLRTPLWTRCTNTNVTVKHEPETDSLETERRRLLEPTIEKKQDTLFHTGLYGHARARRKPPNLDRYPLPRKGLPAIQFLRWLGRVAARHLVLHLLHHDKVSDFHSLGRSLSRQYLGAMYIEQQPPQLTFGRLDNSLKRVAVLVNSLVLEGVLRSDSVDSWIANVVMSEE